MGPAWQDLARVTDATTRSFSAENPSGGKGAGAQASPGDDGSCSPAARELGRGWKVRPCLRDLEPGAAAVLVDTAGPGVVQHVWCTAHHAVLPWLVLRVVYDDHAHAAIEVPLASFFANAVDGLARVGSQVIAVNPAGGMNSYWPMPFRQRLRLEVRNDGPRKVDELFYQVTVSFEDVADDTGYLCARWHRSLTTREHPEHVILDGVQGRGHYVGTYLVWHQLSNHWWGEGEVKFFLDGDPPDAPTICGTGTEDYFGGAWGFLSDPATERRPETYSTPYLGYPQARYGLDPKTGPRVPVHALYRWHIPDPIRFAADLRVTVQALGWWLDAGSYQPLTDDVASLAVWYQLGPTAIAPPLPALTARLPR